MKVEIWYFGEFLFGTSILMKVNPRSANRFSDNTRGLTVARFFLILLQCYCERQLFASTHIYPVSFYLPCRDAVMRNGNIGLERKSLMPQGI